MPDFPTLHLIDTCLPKLGETRPPPGPLVRRCKYEWGGCRLPGQNAGFWNIAQHHPNPVMQSPDTGSAITGNRRQVHRTPEVVSPEPDKIVPETGRKFTGHRNRTGESSGDLVAPPRAR